MQIAHARRIVAIAAALVGAVAVVAVAHGATGGTQVKAAQTTLGKVVVTAQGRTLYMFVADKHGKSACSGKCASFWPPLLTTGKPRAAAGVKASLLGTTTRTGGKLQVTYKGHPLYLFVKDTASGQVNGQGVNGFGALWWVVSPSGTAIMAKSTVPPPATTTTPSSGGGYGGTGTTP